MSARYDVIIVGGGMVGATLACALGREGRRVAVLEARAPTPFSPEADYAQRVSAISRASQRIFQGLGVWEAIASRRISPYEAMRVWDATGPGEIGFDAAALGEPDLGHIVENPVIQDALVESLQAMANVSWLCPARLTGFEVGADGVRVDVEDGSLQASLLVGADGAASRVRELAGIGLDTWAYEQKAVVATVATGKSHRATAWQRFLPTGPLAFLPLADGRSSIVWSADDTTAEALMRLDDAAFMRALGEAFDQRLGVITATGPRAVFPLRGSQAREYVRPRLALIGDAAHTIHPLAGQGVNLGLLDAAVLAECVLNSRHDIGDMRILRRYERSRRGENAIMRRAMEAFKQLFGNERGALRWLRNRGLSLVDHSEGLKSLLMRRAMGVTGDLPELARSVGRD